MILRTISFGKPTYWVAGKFPCNCDQCYQRYSMVIYGYIITYSVGNILPFKHVASWCVCDLGWLKLGEAEIHSPKLESMIAASGCQEHNVKFIDPKWDDKHWWLPSVMADGWVPSLTYFLFWRRQIPDKEITLLFKRWSETPLTNLNFLKFCTIGSGFKSPPNCALLGIFDCYWIYYLIYQLHINTVWSYLRSKTNRFPHKHKLISDHVSAWNTVPFTNVLPINNGDFPLLCYIARGQVYQKQLYFTKDISQKIV